jgi:hypothetical protein
VCRTPVMGHPGSKDPASIFARYTASNTTLLGSAGL